MTQRLWYPDVHTLKMKKVFWCYLIARRKGHLDSTVICVAAGKEGIEMYNTTTPEALKIVNTTTRRLERTLSRPYDKTR